MYKERNDPPPHLMSRRWRTQFGKVDVVVLDGLAHFFGDFFIRLLSLLVTLGWASTRSIVLLAELATVSLATCRTAIQRLAQKVIVVVRIHYWACWAFLAAFIKLVWKHAPNIPSPNWTTGEVEKNDGLLMAI